MTDIIIQDKSGNEIERFDTDTESGLVFHLKYSEGIKIVCGKAVIAVVASPPELSQVERNLQAMRESDE